MVVIAYLLIMVVCTAGTIVGITTEVTPVWSGCLFMLVSTATQAVRSMRHPLDDDADEIKEEPTTWALPLHRHTFS